MRHPISQGSSRHRVQKSEISVPCRQSSHVQAGISEFSPDPLVQIVIRWFIWRLYYGIVGSQCARHACRRQWGQLRCVITSQGPCRLSLEGTHCKSRFLRSSSWSVACGTWYAAQASWIFGFMGWAVRDQVLDRNMKCTFARIGDEPPKIICFCGTRFFRWTHLANISCLKIVHATFEAFGWRMPSSCVRKCTPIHIDTLPGENCGECPWLGKVVRWLTELAIWSVQPAHFNHTQQ